MHHRRRGSVLASTLILAGLSIALTSVTLSVATGQTKRSTLRASQETVNDLSTSAHAWLLWHGAPTVEIMRHVSTDDTSQWNIQPEYETACAGTHTVRLDMKTQPNIIQKTERITLSTSVSPWSEAERVAEAKTLGRYFKIDKEARGYHLRLNGGTILVSRITNIGARWSWDDSSRWAQHDEVIEEEELLQSITLHDDACSAANVFVMEAPVWVDGITDRSVTIATIQSEKKSSPQPIIINGNITKEGNGHIGLFSGEHIIIPLHAPDKLAIHAALSTPNGGLLRRHYCAVGVQGQPARCDRSYADSMIRSSLTLFGSIDGLVAPKWHWDELGTFVSGYQSAEILNDPSLVDAPPPYFPQSIEPAGVRILQN